MRLSNHSHRRVDCRLLPPRDRRLSEPLRRVHGEDYVPRRAVALAAAAVPVATATLAVAASALSISATAIALTAAAVSVAASRATV